MAISRREWFKAGAAIAGATALPRLGSAQSPVNLVFSHHVPTTHLIHGVAEKFADKVKERTKGAVTIDIRPASQLFNLRTSAEALQLGTLDMCWSDLGTLGNWQPQLRLRLAAVPVQRLRPCQASAVRSDRANRSARTQRTCSTSRSCHSAHPASGSSCPRNRSTPPTTCAACKPARAGDSDLGRDGQGARRQSDADSGGRNLHGAADRRVDAIEVAGRLHPVDQDLRGCRLHHPHAPHLHRGLDDGQRHARWRRCRRTCRR